MNKELAMKSIEELAPLLCTKKVSPVEITESIFSQIYDKNNKVNAYIDMYEQEALANAKTVEKEILRGEYKGRLHGIPMALKDNFCFSGRRMTVGSKVLQNYIPDFDATVVNKLKAAGVIFTGSLNMHEFAWGVTTTNPHFGACRNPWDLDRVPGGSSGGSSAAISADMTIASLGSDTGGSIRGPAAACGIIGLKPTYGRISKYGCFPLAWSLDHVGPMTKTVYDAALLLEALAGYDKEDPASSNNPPRNYSELLTGDVRNVVIGIDQDFFFGDIDDEVRKIVMDSIYKLEDLGANLLEVSIPSLQNIQYAQMVTITAESATIHHQNLLERPQDFGDDVRGILEFGELFTAIDYLQAQQIRQEICIEVNEIFNKVDVLISPTQPFTATLIGQDKVMLNGREVKISDYVSKFTRLGNLTGIPAISIPCGLSNGLPVGLQVMGAPYQEEVILNVAKALEQMNLLKGKKPNFL